MSTTVQWLVGVAAGLTALGVIWRQAIRPVVKAATVIAEAAPVLLEIADEFKPNGGTALRDVVDRIDETLLIRTEVIDRIDVDLHRHIEDDKESIARIEEIQSAQALAAATALATAVALRTTTEDTAAALKTTAEETAAVVKADKDAP